MKNEGGATLDRRNKKEVLTDEERKGVQHWTEGTKRRNASYNSGSLSTRHTGHYIKQAPEA